MILYVKINHLRKVEPIQLIRSCIKAKKKFKNSKNVLFIIFLQFEAKFDKLMLKTGKSQFLVH